MIRIDLADILCILFGTLAIINASRGLKRLKRIKTNKSLRIFNWGAIIICSLMILFTILRSCGVVWV